MGLFFHTVLFPGGDEKECRSALRQAAETPELFIHPTECHWHSFKKGPLVMVNNNCRSYEILAEKLSGLLDCPVMVLYIYDGAFWGYHLWQGGEEIDRFASLPDYIKEGNPPKKPGNGLAVASTFGILPENIQDYLIPWTEEEKGSYAYSSDFTPIGGCWQMSDFMDALGFGPSEDKPVRKAQDSPPSEDPSTLPNALNDQKYILRRAKEVRDIAANAVQMIYNKEYKEAVPLLKAEIEAHPNRAALYLLRAFCWSQLEGISGMSRKPDMDRDLSKALETEPDNIMILRARCPTTATTPRYKRHIEDLTRLIELDPENKDLYLVARAYRYHWVGDDVSARADLEDVVSRREFCTVDLVYLCGEFNIPI